ncbi:hypothetical protein BC832DRAFT_561876 [Gaertneriomyces semiglobifer]|nr:hypothetical protein BC832DRAFT_561876 [Gaertneriomyces semiglobifer]
MALRVSRATRTRWRGVWWCLLLLWVASITTTTTTTTTSLVQAQVIIIPRPSESAPAPQQPQPAPPTRLPAPTQPPAQPAPPPPQQPPAVTVPPAAPQLPTQPVARPPTLIVSPTAAVPAPAPTNNPRLPAQPSLSRPPALTATNGSPANPTQTGSAESQKGDEEKGSVGKFLRPILIGVGAIVGTVVICGFGVLVYHKIFKRNSDEDDLTPPPAPATTISRVAKRMTGTFNRVFSSARTAPAPMGPGGGGVYRSHTAPQMYGGAPSARGFVHLKDAEMGYPYRAATHTGAPSNGYPHHQQQPRYPPPAPSPLYHTGAQPPTSMPYATQPPVTSAGYAPPPASMAYNPYA